MKVRYDRDFLLRPYHQFTGGTGALGKDQGHSGLANAQEHNKVEEFLRAVHLLQVVRPGFFSTWSTADGSYQAWGFHLD